MSTKRCVTHYAVGEIRLNVHFPNGETVCRWCPYIRSDESLKRHRCLFTNEFLPFPLDGRGAFCPIRFEEKE